MYGLNDKDTKTQEISTLEAYKLITNIIVANDVEGFTILEANRLLRTQWQVNQYWKKSKNWDDVHWIRYNSKHNQRHQKGFKSRKHYTTNRKNKKWISLDVIGLVWTRQAHKLKRKGLIFYDVRRN